MSNPPIITDVKPDWPSPASHDRIEPSISAWSLPVVMVKKPDGSNRMAIDYKMTNKCTEPRNFPVPVCLTFSIKLVKPNRNISQRWTWLKDFGKFLSTQKTKIRLPLSLKMLSMFSIECHSD